PSLPLSASLCKPPPPPATSTLSLHDALPIFGAGPRDSGAGRPARPRGRAVPRGSGVTTVVLADDHPVVRQGLRSLLEAEGDFEVDRKSTRLNSSHVAISYAVFCLKKKKKTNK